MNIFGIFFDCNISILFFVRSDVITEEEAIKILVENQSGKSERENLMKTKGYPAYTTQIGTASLYSNQYYS